MNLLTKIILGKKTVNLLNEIKYRDPAIHTAIKYLIQNGRLVTPADNKLNYINEGYNKNAIIYSVINMILDKVILPEWGLYKVVKEDSLKEYQRLMQQKNISFKDLRKAKELKAEAVEPLDKFNLQAGKLKELLKYANELDTFSDHQRSLFLYKLLVGDYYEWGEMLKGGANAGVPNALWSLPAHLINIKVTNDFPARPTAYELYTWQKSFTREEVLHEKYVNPNWNINGEQLYGFSPLKPFLRILNRNNSAVDAAAAKFQNGGAEFMIWADDDKLDYVEATEQAKAVKTKWNEEYSGPDNKGKVVISGIKMGGMPIGSTPVELGIIESEKWDAIMICNAFGVPPELLGLTQKTYNNVKEAEKALTMRSAMPLLISRRNAFNWKIQTDWGFKGQNIYVDFDTQCFPELQVDINETMTAIEKLTMVTPNEEREAINMEMLTQPEADEPWTKTGRTPLSDYQATEVDDALNAGLNGTGNGAGNGEENNNGARANQNGKARVPYSKEMLS